MRYLAKPKFDIRGHLPDNKLREMHRRLDP